MIKELRKKIFETAHRKESSNSVRDYFSLTDIDSGELTKEQLEKLRIFINKEIYVLLVDETYSMVKKLYIPKVIKKDRYGNCTLPVDSSYFKAREGITFHKDGFIALCGWASGCNRIPFIKGFVEWCDWIKSKEGSKYKTK